MEHGKSYFDAFREISLILTSTLDIDEVTSRIARLTAEAARASRVAPSAC
jgi:hypothetical protein